MDNLTEDNEIESFVTSMPGSLEAWTKVSNEEVKAPVSESSWTICDVLDWIIGQFKTICYVGLYLIFHLVDTALFSIPYAFYRIPHLIDLIPQYIQRICSFICRQFRTSTASSSSTNAMIPQPASRCPLVATSDHEKSTIREFCWRIGHFLGACKNRAVFTRDEVSWMRYRACLEVMASLVSFADLKAGWFGDIQQVLGDIGSFERARNLSLSGRNLGRDEAFALHWTCLSIMAIRPTLNTSLLIGLTFNTDEFLYLGDFEKPRAFDGTLEHQWGGEHYRDLSSIISFATENQEFKNIINSNIVEFDEVGQRITHELPGVDFDFPDSEPILRLTLELFRDPAKLRFMSCRQPLKFFEYLKRVDAYRDNSPNPEYERNQVIEKLFWPKHLLQRMLWSIDDLRQSRIGFYVELFLLSLRQLLSTYPSQETYSALYIGTFRAITSDRKRYMVAVGTLRLLLDIVASDQGFLRTFNYPDYIMDEVWELLRDILEVQFHVMMPHPVMDNAVLQLTDFQREVGGKYGAKAEALRSSPADGAHKVCRDRGLP
jgi:hypothetical protein